MKKETKFRTGKVDPFLKTLENCFAISLQQVSLRGDADKILCINGWYVWLELKTDTGKLSKLQEYKASLVRAAGGMDLLARPSNWGEVKAFLIELNKGIYDQNHLRRIREN